MVAPRALTLLLLAALAVGGGRPASAADCVALEDFSQGAVREFPPDWKPRTVPSAEAERTRLPSLLYAKPLIRPVWPNRGRSKWSV